MNSNVPISPPITPKEKSHLEFIKKQDTIYETTLIPIITPHHDLSHINRKSNARKFNRVMATSTQDTITWDISLFLTDKTRSNKKATPHKSLLPSTSGCFTMNVLQQVNLPSSKIDRILHSACELTLKKRNHQETEEAIVVPPVTIQPVFSTHSILNTERHVKKSKTDAAAAYDLVDIMISDEDVFKNDPKWIPNLKVFEKTPFVKVIWKGSPLPLQNMPFYELLHPGEVHIASTLRLTPEQYLKCKRALIMAAQEFHKMNINFRKSDAQKCVRIDVNKTSSLWGVFNQLGWFNPLS